MILQQRTVSLALLVMDAIALIWVSGVAFWLALGLATLGLGGVLLPAQSAGTASLGTSRFARFALVVGSVFGCLMLLEAGLWILERAAGEPLPGFDTEAGAVPLAPELPPEIRTRIERMQSALVMPPAWEKRDLARNPGADPYVWHGVTHLVDANGMRRDEPFPPPDPERYRIMVVGDSLTFGEGIDAFWTYPAQLERSLTGDFRVEVLNLGVGGYSSADVLGVIRRFVPELEPNLVIYGVCLNDFLDSGDRQPDPFSLLPTKISKILSRRTRVGQLVGDRFGALARVLGLEPNFYTELLTDFDRRRQRFASDVAAMNAFVTENGLPPMMALVLDQRPMLQGPGRKLALAAEEQLRAAGMETLDSEAFYRRYDGRWFRVSRWEGHPNEEANAIWASELADAIRNRPALAAFRRRHELASDRRQ